MKRKILLLTLVIGSLSNLTFSQSNIEVANGNYFNLRMVQAKEDYEQIWRGSGQDEKIAAGKQLVNISWKFYENYETAKEYSDSLLILSPNNFDILLQIADISIQAEAFENAKKYLNLSIDNASEDRQIKDLRIKYAEYVLAKPKASLLNIKNVDINEASKALEFLKEYYQKEPNNLRITRLYLGLALLLNRDAEIINAWRTYFRIPRNEKLVGLLAPAEENIRKGLELDSKDGAINLVKGLSDSRFFDYAVMMMFQNNLDYENTADLADIYHYYLFLKDVEGLIYDYYRGKSIGIVSDIKYYKDYYSLCIDFWFALN